MTKHDDAIRAAEIAGGVNALRMYAKSLDDLERNVIASGRPGPVIVQLSSVISGLYESAKNLERAARGETRQPTQTDTDRTDYLDDHLDT